MGHRISWGLLGVIFTFGSILWSTITKTPLKLWYFVRNRGKNSTTVQKRNIWESIIWNLEKQKSSTLDNLMVGDLRYCIVLLFIMCTLSGDLNKLTISLTFTFSRNRLFWKMGYINVGHGCWRRNVLVTTFGYWWTI